MIRLEVAKENNARDLLKIYDSSNTIFDTIGCASGTIEMFDEILQGNKSILAYIDDNAVGFIAYNDLDDPIILNSLYIRRDFQRIGIGKTLLSNFERSVHGKYVVARVLKNAYWAISFYSSNGYHTLVEDDDTELHRDILRKIQIEKWSYIMFKHLV